MTECLLKSLQWIEKNLKSISPTIHFFLDSQLVAFQLSGKYKVKNKVLKNLFREVQNLIAKLDANISFKAIGRDNNREADKLVNMALDGKIS